jgi:hypothetical protein
MNACYGFPMSQLPPAPYPDGTPDFWARDVLPQGERGPGDCTRFANTGDYVFHSGVWQTIHGMAIVVRSDKGAFKVWGALLGDGRRVHCRRSRGWRRRSDDGRSWVLGDVRFEEEEVYFRDADNQRILVAPEGNVFARAMAAQPRFLERIRDDSFASTLNDILRVMGVELCTLDGSVTWTPDSSDEISDTIAWLRGFGEYGATDFSHRGLLPNPPRTPGSVVAKALADVGWRFDDSYAWLAQEEEASR